MPVHPTNDLLIGMAGAGGDGVISAGEALMAAAARSGYRAIMTKSYGSQIRGGESSFRLRLSTGPLWNVGGVLDVAVALNWDDFLRFGAELPVGGRTTVIYDAASGATLDDLPLIGVRPQEAIAVPIAELARRHSGSERAKNSVVLGLLAAWLGVSPEGLLAGLRKRFSKKLPAVLEGNERAFDAGLAFAGAHPLRARRQLAMADPPTTPRLLTDGNSMCGAAAIFAGCSFFAGYPITPSSEIMEFLSGEIWRFGGTVLQAEDEIAGIGACVGASFAGRKAMSSSRAGTATASRSAAVTSHMRSVATST